MKLHEKYPAIWAWGRMMGSYGYYMEAESERAERDGAPRLATYKDSQTGEWHTLDGAKNPDTHRWFRQNAPDLAREAWGPETVS